VFIKYIVFIFSTLRNFYIALIHWFIVHKSMNIYIHIFVNDIYLCITIQRISFAEAQLKAFIYNSEQWTRPSPNKYCNRFRKIR